jgi:hypothetical protein
VYEECLLMESFAEKIKTKGRIARALGGKLRRKDKNPRELSREMW